MYLIKLSLKIETYPQLLTYPDNVTMADIKTKRNIIVLNTIRVMVGLARGPNDEAIL